MNLGEPRDIEKEKREIADRERTLMERKASDLRKILEMPEGRRFIWSLMEEAKVFHQTYTGNSDTFFNEGKRFIGLGLINAVMSAKGDYFTKMQREHASDPLKKPLKGTA